jgi:tetratricopeptide (TPR) repeat protein
MPKKPSSKSKQQNIEVDKIKVGGSIGGPLIVGNDNVINLSHEQISLRSLHQLPPPPADFTGREALIEQLLNDFNSHKGATISGLTGMGGIGKTALGLVVANELMVKYPDAQIFLDLKGTTEPLSVLDIARHVILSFEPNADLRALNDVNMLAAYQSVLHGRKVLLFLDNARSAEQIVQFRPPDTCAMLVTSRWTFSVPGLKTRRVDVMNEGDAELFLLELCSRIGEKATALVKACTYLPLALRIAGSFLQVNSDWSLGKYLTQLNDRKKRLATLKESHEDAELNTEPDLLATFELSYNELSDEDKKLWRMLGVFPASFDISAAQSMWDLPEDQTSKLLSSLRRYSLLEYDENVSRYHLHDLLADYALSKLDRAEEISALIAHSVHYIKVLFNINELYLKGGDDLLLGLQLYDAEWINIEMGQRTSVIYMEENRRAAQACNWYAKQASINNLRLNPTYERKWIEDGLHAAKLLKDRSSEGTHLGNLGNVHLSLGNFREAIQFGEQALKLYREIGDHFGEESKALGNLGLAFMELGNLLKAIDFYNQQLTIVQKIGDRIGKGNALNNLGLAFMELGDNQQAVEYFEQSLMIKRESGDLRGEGNTLGNLGSIYVRLGYIAKALEFYEQRLNIARKIGDIRGEGNAMNNLGRTYGILNDYHKALEFCEKALVIARKIGDRDGEGNALFNIGWALYGLQERNRAISTVKQALEIYDEIESPVAKRARNTLKEWGAKE